MRAEIRKVTLNTDKINEKVLSDWPELEQYIKEREAGQTELNTDFMSQVVKHFKLDVIYKAGLKALSETEGLHNYEEFYTEMTEYALTAFLANSMAYALEQRENMPKGMPDQLLKDLLQGELVSSVDIDNVEELGAEKVNEIINNLIKGVLHENCDGDCDNCDKHEKEGDNEYEN
ncbi:MAG: hypothetical protein HGB11_13480 [Chlorobiales bacterium]|nr:hypothetical protein [Chlorobiales bacterium]